MARIRAVSPAIPNRLRRANRRGPRTARPAIRHLRLYGRMRRKRGVPAQRRNSIPARMVMVISYRRFIWGLHPCRGVPLAVRGGREATPARAHMRGSLGLWLASCSATLSTGRPFTDIGHRTADPSTAHARGNLMSDSFNLCLESAGTRGEGGDPVWGHMKWHFRQNGLSRLCHRND